MKKPPVISITEKNAIIRKRANILSVENLNNREHPGVATLNSNEERKFSKRYSVSRQFGSRNKSNLAHQPGFESKTLPVDNSLTEIQSINNCRQQSLNSDFLERQNILRKVCAMKVNNFFTPSSRQEDYAAVLLKKKCCSNSNINVLHNGQCYYDDSENSLTNDVTHGNSAEKIEGIIEVSADIPIYSIDNSEKNRPFLENFTRYSHPSHNFTCREYLLSLGQLFKQYKDSAYETYFLLRRKFNAFFEFCWFEINQIVGSVFLFVFDGIRNACDELGKYYFRFFAFANGLWALITNGFHSALSMIRSWIFVIVDFIRRCLTSLVVGVRGVSRSIAVPTIFISKGVPKYNESQPQAIGTESMLFQIFKFFINNVRKCYKLQPPPAVTTSAESISVPEPISQPNPEPPTLVMNASISDSLSDSELIVQNALSTSRAWENSFAYEKIYPDIAEDFNAVLSPEHNDEFQLSSPILVAKSRSEETVSYELIYGKNGEDYIPTQSDTSSPEFVGFDEFKREEDDIHLSQIYPTGDTVCTPSLVLTSQFVFPHSAIYDFNSNEGHVLDNFRRGNLDFENIENYQLYEGYPQDQNNGTAEQLLYGDGDGVANVFELLQSPCSNEKSVSVNESTSDDSAFMGAAVSSEEQQSSHSKDGRLKIVESPFVDLTDVYLARSYDDSLEHEYIIPDLCRTQLASGTRSGYTLYN